MFTKPDDYIKDTQRSKLGAESDEFKNLNKNARQ